MPNAFVAKKHEPILNIYVDKYYYDVKLVDKVKKVEGSEDDFIIVKEEVVTKTDIKELIDSQADDVGLNNVLKQFALTGDPGVLPSGVNPNGGDVLDCTQLPNDLIDADIYFKNMRAKFDALPDDIKAGRNFQDFMTTFTQAEFDKFVASLKPVESNGKKEGEE